MTHFWLTSLSCYWADSAPASVFEVSVSVFDGDDCVDDDGVTIVVVPVPFTGPAVEFVDLELGTILTSLRRGIIFGLKTFDVPVAVLSTKLFGLSRC